MISTSNSKTFYYHAQDLAYQYHNGMLWQLFCVMVTATMPMGTVIWLMLVLLTTTRKSNTEN